ncbi:uncharacterized protein LOC131804075 [Musca domestica]|uniref:Uncharacterized protein LOC131804075 n=1 Tax=Musca domestica TaxID=7370 RepID=A0ABM3V9B0_MUSDO|nr:uncharacterized protein LOC131804075 [Musca domestica]
MSWKFFWKLFALMQILYLSESSHVQLVERQKPAAEVTASMGHLLTSPAPAHPLNQSNLQQQSPVEQHRRHYDGQRPHRNRFHHWNNGQRVHRVYTNENRRHHHHPRRHPYHRWTPRRRPSRHHHHHEPHYFFGQWSPWSSCSPDCMKRRERHCKIKRKCGHSKHIEERQCRRCHPAATDASKWSTSTSSSLPPHGVQPIQQQQQQQQQHTSNTVPTIVINAAAAAATAPIAASVGSQTTHQPTLWSGGTPTESYNQHPVIQSEELVAEHVSSSTSGGRHEYWRGGGEEVDDDDSVESDFYVIKAKRKRPPHHRSPPKVSYPDIPVHHELSDYSEEQAEDALNELGSAQPPSEYLQTSPTNVKTMRHHPRPRRPQRQNPRHHRKGKSNGFKTFDDGSEGEVFQYEDFDIDLSHGDNQENGGDMSYEEFSDYNEYRNLTGAPPAKERATPEHLIPKHRRIYSKWSRWTKCTPKCTTRRYKKCRVREQCGREVLREIAYCYTEGSFCQQWLNAQVQKLPAYELRPSATRRRDVSDDGAISNSIVSDFIMNGKGYRGPEYTPMKLKCGIAPIRSNKRNMYNMLKIIGGKAARKGEWPWQVAIFNRFKEAFCGGTLIAPQWVLTAAHCVRKVLYVRLGEHNLDHEDGTEMHLKVLKSYKHPSFDKKTVDSDVALLKLPKPVNTTTWIGFSCLPKPYQPLPKNIECTVIGWGKRRNRDVAGTSVLHQAEVPIISMDNCRSVYYDYTITKNMFCAGHKRGRIDTCAGDSGGPLLCRDNTKPNHPWTIFGITSFGDGCAKRNKFGIYAKVPNYVDWVWSVINCNGNCKMHQRL